MSTSRETFEFSMRALPEETSPQGFLFSGASGSGKTLQLKRQLNSVLKGFGPHRDRRMLVYDFKAELSGFLWAAVGNNAPGIPFYFLNPADQRSSWWHLALDILSEADCHQIASILVPKEMGEKNPYYTLTTRNILARLMISFMRHSPRDWYFRDLMCALSSKALYRRVLERDEDTASALRVGSPETEANVDTTVNNVFNQFSIVAAFMDAAQRAKHPPISVRHWVRTPGVMILPMDPTLVSVLEPFFRMFIHTLTQHILALPESDTRRTWIVLDEFHTLKPVESFPNFVTNSRSKGACNVLAIQNVSSVVSPTHYGELGDVILGEMKNKMFFTAPTHKHAEWCASEYARVEWLKETTASGEQWGTQFDGSGKQTGTQYTASKNYAADFQTEYLRLPSEFQALSLAKNSGLIEAFSIIQGKRIPCRETLKDALAKNVSPGTPMPGFMRVPPAWERLRMWTKDDFLRLGLSDPNDELFNLIMNIQPPQIP